MTKDAGMEDRETILGIYTLSVTMADRVSGRRALANNFYLAVHSALVVGLLFAPSRLPSPAGLDSAVSVGVAVVGVVLAGLWRLSLRGYAQLNNAKYNAILQIERSLPVKPLTEEWKKLSDMRQRRWGKYRDLGWVERKVPLMFMVLYLTFLVAEGF